MFEVDSLVGAIDVNGNCTLRNFQIDGLPNDEFKLRRGIFGKTILDGTEELVFGNLVWHYCANRSHVPIHMSRYRNKYKLSITELGNGVFQELVGKWQAGEPSAKDNYLLAHDLLPWQYVTSK